MFDLVYWLKNLSNLFIFVIFSLIYQSTLCLKNSSSTDYIKDTFIFLDIGICKRSNKFIHKMHLIILKFIVLFYLLNMQSK